MEKIVALNNVNNIEKLKEFAVTHILVSDVPFSSSIKGLTLQQLQEMSREAHKAGLKIIVKADRLYHQFELDDLKNYLRYLESIAVDAVMFSDLTVKMICDQLGLKLNTIYAPETLLTNSYDVNALRQDKFTNCVISKDIPESDVYDIAQDNPDYCYLRVFGPILIAYSKRRFVSLYLDEKKEYLEKYYLQEETRTALLPIVEKETGSWLYGYTLESLDQMEKLSRSKMKGLIFDNILHDDDYMLAVLEIYKQKEMGMISYDSALNALKQLDPKVTYTALADIKNTTLDKE